MAGAFMPEITNVTARRFVKALSDGVPPRDPLTAWLTVGQTDLMTTFHEDLKAVGLKGLFEIAQSLLPISARRIRHSHLLSPSNGPPQNVS